MYKLIRLLYLCSAFINTFWHSIFDLKVEVLITATCPQILYKMSKLWYQNKAGFSTAISIRLNNITKTLLFTEYIFFIKGNIFTVHIYMQHKYFDKFYLVVLTVLMDFNSLQYGFMQTLQSYSIIYTTI